MGQNNIKLIQVELKRLKWSSKAILGRGLSKNSMSQMFLYIREKLMMEVGFSTRDHCTGLWIGIHRETRGTEKIIGLWSEKLSSQIVVSETHIPCVKIKSNVWPCTWEGPSIHWERSKDSIKFKNSFDRESVPQQTWIFKSPMINSLSYFVTGSLKSSANSSIKSVVEFGGRWISATTTVFSAVNLNSCYSKLLNALADSNWQESLFLKTEACPPLRPEVRGEFRNK